MKKFKVFHKWKGFELFSYIFLALFSFGLYVFTLFPTVSSEDSGEFVSAAYTLGIPHAPGYPLYVLIGKLFTFIPFGNIAWRVNLMSAFFASLTVFFLYLLLRKLIKNHFVAFFVSLTFAVSEIFWSQAIRAEVYTLNSFFFIFILYLCFLCYENFRISLLYLILFLYGLSLTNHQQMFLLAPALFFFLYVVTKKHRLSYALISSEQHDYSCNENASTVKRPSWIKISFFSIFFFLLGFSIYLFLPLRSLQNPLLDTGDPETWQNFWWHLSRKGYGGTIKVETFSSIDDIPFFKEFSAPLGTLFFYVKNIFVSNGRRFFIFFSEASSQFTSFLLLPGLFFLLFFKKFASKVNFLFWCFLFVTVLMYSVLLYPVIDGSPYSPANAFLSRPFYIPFYIGFSFFIALFLDFLFSRISFMERGRKILYTWAFVASLFIVFVSIFSDSFYLNNQRKNDFMYDYARSLLNAVEKDSVLKLAMSDSLVYDSFYLQNVEHFRDDVRLFIPRGGGGNWAIWSSYEKIKILYPDSAIYTDDPFSREENYILKGKGPVYEITGVSESNAGLQSVDLAALQAYEVYLNDLAEKNSSYYADIFHRYQFGLAYFNLGYQYRLVDIEKSDRYFYRASEYAYDVSEFKNYIAKIFLLDDSPEKVPALYENSIALFYNDFLAYYYLGSSYFLQEKYEQAEPYLEKAKQINPAAYHLRFGRYSMTFGDFEKAVEHFTELTVVAPEFPTGYFHLGEVYEQMGNFEAAKLQYEKVISLDDASSLAEISRQRIDNSGIVR